MNRRNSKVAHFDEDHVGPITLQRQQSQRALNKIQQHYDSVNSPRSLHRATHRSNNSDDDVRIFNSSQINQLQRQSSHRTLHSHHSHHSVGDYEEGLSARSDKSAQAFATRTDSLHNLVFKNFKSNDLFDSNCFHTTYNEFESRLIRETKYYR